MANLSNINNILRTNSTGVGIFADAGSYPLEISSAGTAGVKLLNTAGATYDVYANASEEFIIAKNGVGNRLTINSGGDATFSGNVTINGHITSDGSAKVEGGGVPAMMGVTRITTGAGYTTGVKSTTGGSGTGMTVKVASSVLTGIDLTVTIENPGSGYQIGDVLTVSGGTAGNLATIKLVSGQSFTIFSTTSTGTQNVLKPGVAFGYQDNVIAPGGVIAAANNSNSVATHTISSSMGGTQTFDIYTITDKRLYNVQAGWTITGSPVDTRPNTVVSYVSEREVDFISFQVESPALQPPAAGPGQFPANNVFTFTGPNAANNLYFKTGRGRGYDTKMTMLGQGDTLLMIGINPTENQIINQGTFNNPGYNLLLMGQPGSHSVSNNPSFGGLKIENYNAAGTVTSSALFNATNCITGSGTFSGNVNISSPGDFYINSGTSYNDKGSIFMSNQRTEIVSDIVDGTANGDTSLNFKTRSGGATASAIFIDEFRRIGIGTDSPGNLLDVAGDTDISGQLFVTHNSNYVAKIKQTATSMSNAAYTFEIDSTSHDSNLTAAGAMSVDVETGRAFTINGLGNIGVGTSNPAQNFVVAEATDQHGIELVPGTLSYIQAYDRATSDYGNLHIDAQKIGFGLDNGAEKVTFLANGNVGIGTDSPSKRLHVEGSNHIVTFENTSTVANAYSQMMLQAGSAQNYIWTQNQNSTSYGGANSLNIYTQQAGAIAFFTSAYERMRISANGTVQIGASSTTNLSLGSSGSDFQLSAKKDGTDAINMVFKTQASGGTLAERMRITSSGQVKITNTGAAVLTLQSGTSQTASLRLKNDISDWDLNCQTNDNFAIFDHTAGLERLSINTTGKLKVLGLGGYTPTGSDVRYDTGDGEIYYQTSSKRYKTDIVNLENSLDKIISLRPVRYKDINTGTPACGLIAEETFEIIPDVVFNKKIEGFDKPQIEGLNYSDLVPFLIKSIQELKAEIEILKNKSCTCNNCNCNK